MGEGLHVDAKAVARRCAVKTPDYTQFTPLDWVVLDFTNGVMCFDDMCSIIPASRSDLAVAFIHLRLLGFLTWNKPGQTGSLDAPDFSNPRTVRNDLFEKQQLRRNTAEYEDGAVPTGLLLSASNPTVSRADMTDCRSYSDELCAEYLPPRLLAEFRAFKPTMVDETLEMAVEKQVFAEFLHSRLSTLSPFDLLGLTETTNKQAVKQAFVQRTKQFHPDRFFRKNIGPFSQIIATLFKAFTAAFTSLQSRL